VGMDLGKLQVKEIQEKLNSEVFPQSIGHLLSEKARKLKGKPACVFFEEGTTLTYEQLDIYSNQLANSLLNLGVRKGTHVAVMIPNNSAFPITWMAIAKIGAVIVPVNVNYTASELSYVLNHSDATILLIDEYSYETYIQMNEEISMIENFTVVVRGNVDAENVFYWDELLARGDKVFTAPVKVTLHDLTNIQYTSGTTGFPKGCMLTHYYWLLMAKSATYFTKDRIENILIQFPFFYMEPQVELIMSFFQEGTVYVPIKPSLTKFIDWIREYNIHYCAFPEPIMKSVPPSEMDSQNELKFISAYQYKGQAHIDLEKRFNVTGRDTFAMTEIGLGTHMPEASTHMVGSGSCGLPAPLRKLRIVDDNGQDVSQGEEGELWVSGPGMLWGYYKNSKANREAFSGDWFRTGDLAKQDENGYYYIVGRIKEMIKRSGENISALEIESVIEEIPGVIEVAAIPVPDDIRREEVKVYIQLQKSVNKEDISPSKIVTHCEKKLASFKIPRYFEYVTSFPRTPSDKIAKQQLIKAVDDLRKNSYDRVANKWR